MGRLIAAAPVLLLLGALAACDGEKVIGPDNQLEVTNAADNFQWQVSVLDNVTQTLSYTWQHTGTVAKVNQSPSAGASGATLTIKDHAGTQVYTKSLATAGDFETSAGTAGNWTIEVALSGASGTLNFRVQKKP